VEGRKRCGKKRAEEKRRTRKKGINICGVGKKTEGLTANFTLAVYIQFLVAADTVEYQTRPGAYGLGS
jgi:hypothetical protein